MRCVVGFDALQNTPERRAHHQCEPNAGRERRGQDHVVAGRGLAEIEQNDVADRGTKMIEQQETVRPAEEVAVVGQKEQHLREGKRCHDEIDAVGAQRKNADDQGAGSSAQ